MKLNLIILRNPDAPRGEVQAFFHELPGIVGHGFDEAEAREDLTSRLNLNKGCDIIPSQYVGVEEVNFSVSVPEDNTKISIIVERLNMAKKALDGLSNFVNEMRQV